MDFFNFLFFEIIKKGNLKFRIHLDMRTRLASLIIVKQEPIAHDFNVDGENETINYHNNNNDDLANHFYGQNRLENFNGIGDLNNNNSKEEFEDHKSM